VDFAEEIFRAVAACQVLLAIIGPAWLIAADEFSAVSRRVPIWQLYERLGRSGWPCKCPASRGRGWRLPTTSGTA
jgi:hypothetical protein